MGTLDDALAGYAQDAAALAERYEAVASERLFAPVADLLPAAPARVADVGAGTGRDAAWFAAQGHAVTAIEPVAAMRQVVRAGTAAFAWVDDRLPDLSRARRLGPFDLVTAIAVWQHVPREERGVAAASLAAITAASGLLVARLRHGPAAEGRPGYAICADETVALFEAQDFRLLRRVEVAAEQAVNRAAGVRWTWVALRR